MNIYVDGRRSFLIGQYAQARKQHRPSGRTWQQLHEATNAELKLTAECESAVERALADETRARLRASRLWYLVMIAGWIAFCIGWSALAMVVLR